MKPCLFLSDMWYIVYRDIHSSPPWNRSYSTYGGARHSIIERAVTLNPNHRNHYIIYLIHTLIYKEKTRKSSLFLHFFAIFFSITDIHLVGTRVEISLYVILSVPAECKIQEFVVYRTDRMR